MSSDDEVSAARATTQLIPTDRPLERSLAIGRHAANDPDRPAVTSATGELTFGELNGRINKLARALRRRGLGPGGAIALICSNRAEFVEVYFAATRSGLRLTPINWHLTSAEAGYILDNCQAAALIAEDRFMAAAVEAAGDVPGARVRIGIGAGADGFENYEDLLSGEDPHDLADPVEGSVMLYTSGTTGRPKGVYRRRQPSFRFRWSFDYRPGTDRDLAAGPLYHTAPAAYTLSTALPKGVGTVLLEEWDSTRVLELIERFGITHAHMVPTMLYRLISLPPEIRAAYDLSSLRAIVHGAAPCPVSLKQKMFDWLGPILYEYYAATEGAGTFVEPAEWLARPGTVGKPEPADHVFVGDPSGLPLPAGEVGLVYIKAPPEGRFEYFGDAAKTVSAYRGDYFTLGDMGYMDKDRYLFLTDRDVNVIISGGVNIYPAEVDAVLLEHPAVEDAAVIGVPSEEWGEEVKAVVQLAPGACASDELARQLIDLCRARLAHYKCPRSVAFEDSLPRQDNGKIYKEQLRQRYRTGPVG